MRNIRKANLFQEGDRVLEGLVHVRRRTVLDVRRGYDNSLKTDRTVFHVRRRTVLDVRRGNDKSQEQHSNTIVAGSKEAQSSGKDTSTFRTHTQPTLPHIFRLTLP